MHFLSRNFTCPSNFPRPKKKKNKKFRVVKFLFFFFFFFSFCLFLSVANESIVSLYIYILLRWFCNMNLFFFISPTLMPSELVCEITIQECKTQHHQLLPSLPFQLLRQHPQLASNFLSYLGIGTYRVEAIFFYFFLFFLFSFSFLFLVCFSLSPNYF